MKRSFVQSCFLHVVVGTTVVWSLIDNPLACGQGAAIQDVPNASGSDPTTQGKEAEWIWSPAYEKDAVPDGACYFRKTFTSRPIRRAEIHVAADNAYELYVNGKLLGQGADWRAMDIYRLNEHLRAGQNTIAIKASNVDAGTAGLVARVLVQHTDGSYVGYSTDTTWRTSVKEFANWQQPGFREAEWLPAKSYGPLGEVLPWGNEVVLAGIDRRFQVADEKFAVERLLEEEHTGSLIAMCFDHRGDLLLSQEGGPLLVYRDVNRDGRLDEVSTFCDELKNVQGILPIGNRVLAVGEGPQGGALYALTDADQNGRADQVQALVRFEGSTGEHGPHAVRLGPDGLIYVMVGNFARSQSSEDRGQKSTEPYGVVYEGDLVRPRYEDPRGHAVGVTAPGGTVVRTDAQGSFVEVVAGGLRNPYDFAFTPAGEIFTYDADMEWDIGAPWYRPTRILHVTPGAEFGWRSGWAKWPAYYVDSLPGTLDMGPGSPTGVEVYEHFAFPEKYRGAIFGADWARGRINAVFVQPQGASYAATSEVFVEGTPLNVADLAVGPDGALYFCTGGRGTEGGVYRVRYTGTVPPERSQLGSGLTRALRQPQLDAPWAQAQIAKIKRELAAQWGSQLLQVARNGRLDAQLRVRALDLLQLYGPRPEQSMLLELSRDSAADVRARATLLLGTSKDSAPQVADRLSELLGDASARVRRVAAEAALRRGTRLPPNRLLALLKDKDRFVRFAARRALERQPVDPWRDGVLESQSTRVFIEGSIALLMAGAEGRDTSAQDALAILERVTRMFSGDVADPQFPKGFISDPDFVDLLRVTHLALLQSEEAGGSPADWSTPKERLGQVLLQEYPTSNPVMNRELVRLMVYLQVAGAAPRMIEQIESDEVTHADKLHVAAYAPRLKEGWMTEHKIALIKYYDAARRFEGGYSLSAYVENFSRDFFATFSVDEKRQMIRAGGDWPSAALSVLATLPPQPGAEVLADIRQLDAALADRPGDPIARLRVGVVAVLARSGDSPSLEYLRQIYQNEPERRPVVAMALTQDPTGANWPLLVDSLRIVDGPVAVEILASLVKVDRKPSEAAAYRDAIVLGLKSEGDAHAAAARLVAHWAGLRSALDLRQAQAWYARQFPDAPPAELPRNSGRNKWSYDELLSFLESERGRSGDPRRGLAVFEKAQCATCHRYDSRGESIGPDLTTVARRFHTKEVLEAIVYPSHVVSDQYASKLVEANGRTYNGLVVPEGSDALVVLTSDGRKHRLPKAAIDAITDSDVSVMPDSLLNMLTLEEVADLFAYLRSEPRVAGSAAAPAVERQ